MERAMIKALVLMGYSNGTIAADSILTDNDKYLDMDTVTGYSGTATGIELYTEDRKRLLFGSSQ